LKLNTPLINYIYIYIYIYIFITFQINQLVKALDFCRNLKLIYAFKHCLIQLNIYVNIYVDNIKPIIN
jgi:hypothetical protein